MVSITYIIELILDLWNCGSTVACGLFDLYRIETDSVSGLMYNCACKYYLTIVYDLWKEHNKLDFECKYWHYLFVNILWTNKNLGLPCHPENVRPTVNELLVSLLHTFELCR